MGAGAAAAEPSLKQSLAAFGATLRGGITLKDLEVMRVDITARAARTAAPASVADELAAIGAVQDLWDIIVHGWTCRNFTAHESACIASVGASMQSLGLPYQVVAICTGDMGGPDARQLDIETWMPGEGKYRETHTADLMTDYQSRRLGTKVKRKDGKTEFVHMNDATVFSGRPIIAIMENYQTEEGKIEVPAALQKYIGKKIIG